MLSILVILTIAWLLILIGAVLIFKVIVPFSYWGGFYDSMAKGAFTTVLALIWLYIFALMRSVFVQRNILAKKHDQRAEVNT